MFILVRSAKTTALAAVALLGFVGAGAAITTKVVTGSSSSAHRAQGPTLYVSAAGSDGGPCSRARPCQSFDGAYRRASPGSTVLIASGSYPAQTIGRDTSKTSGACDGYTIGASLTGCVTFQPDSGASVALSGGVLVYGDYVRLRNLNLGTITIGDCSSSSVTTNVVLQNDSGANLVINNASYVGDLKGNWGPLHGNQIVYVNDCSYTGTLKEATHVRFDGGVYHDAIQDSNGQHLECLHVEPADYVTIRNSTFRNCAQHDIEIGGSEPETNFLIENNAMARPCSEQGSVCGGNNPLDMSCLSGPHSDWTVRFNSMDGGAFFLNTGCTWTGTNLYYGNIETFTMDSWQCSQWAQYGWTRSYTVGGSSGIACGTGSVTGTVLVSPGPPDYDFHLLPGSVAIGLVPAGMARPATDVVGNPRGTGATDAGAYMRGRHQHRTSWG
jgi:hypothetical protein